jgi:hypothetical protein
MFKLFLHYYFFLKQHVNLLKIHVDHRLVGQTVNVEKLMSKQFALVCHHTLESLQCVALNV